MRLIFIRHGDPDYETDTLTEKGVREAACLAERIGRWDIEAAFASPLGRADETARRGLSKTDLRAETKDWLQEFHGFIIDPDTGKQRIPWDLMPSYWTREDAFYHRDTWLDVPLMRTGTVREVYESATAGLDGLLETYGYRRDGGAYRVTESRDGALVFFCHLGISLALIGHLTGIAPPLLWHGVFVPTCSISVLTSEEREADWAYFRCQTIGDTAHLLMGGEPVSEKGAFNDPFQG